MAVHFRGGGLVRDGGGHALHARRKRGNDPAPFRRNGHHARHVRAHRDRSGGSELVSPLTRKRVILDQLPRA
jgi:hypothetical protein